MQMNRFEYAKSSFDMAIKLDKNDAFTNYNLGILYYYSTNYNDALQYLSNSGISYAENKDYAFVARVLIFINNIEKEEYNLNETVAKTKEKLTLFINKNNPKE